MTKRIVIIGAGPIGCYLSQILRAYGFQPLLIEEHSEVGRPVHCTGLVGNKVFEDNKPFNVSTSSVINVINGAVVHYDDQQFVIHRKKVAYVIDREKFDKELSKGLDILYQNKFLGIERNKSGYTIETDKDELFADIVIGADGANSATRRILNSGADVRIYKGIQLRLRFKARHKDLVEVYFRRPSFFWIVPEVQDILRVGTISENPYTDLQNFLREINIKGEILDRFGGVVAVGICQATVKDNIALVGDAACQMKPLTYGGIYFGLESARILASCIKENRLNDYDAEWKKKFVFEIKFGLKVRELYRRLDSKEIEKIFSLLRKQKSLIEKMADFENHSHLILEIIKNPALYPRIGELFYLLFNKIL